MARRTTRAAPPEPLEQQHTDQQLLAALRGTDEAASHAAFVVIARTHNAAITATAAWMLRDQDAADDVAQTVLVAFWENRATVRIRGTIKAYLVRAAHNAAYNVWREQEAIDAGKAELEIHARDMDDNAGPANVLEAEAVECIREVLARMSPMRRCAFELCFFNHLTHQECADALEIRKQTVKNHINYVNQQLRLALTARGVEAA